MLLAPPTTRCFLSWPAGRQAPRDAGPALLHCQGQEEREGDDQDPPLLPPVLLQVLDLLQGGTWPGESRDTAEEGLGHRVSSSVRGSVPSGPIQICSGAVTPGSSLPFCHALPPRGECRGAEAFLGSPLERSREARSCPLPVLGGRTRENMADCCRLPCLRLSKGEDRNI